MKKFILFLLLAVCGISVHANENYILSDDVTPEGTRMIKSNYGTVYADWGRGATGSLGCIKTSSGEVVYLLTICFNEGTLTMNKGSLLLLKLGDDSTIELKLSNEIGPADYSYQTTQYGTFYYVYATYEITEAQIQRMIDNGVTKMRVQWTGGNFDRKPKRLSKHLSNVYPAVKNALNQQKSFYDDF